MQKRPILLTIAACFWVYLAVPHLLAAGPSEATASDREDAIIKLVKAPFKGDLDEIRQRRMIRVLVNYSRTRFFYNGGHARGFEPELLTGC